MRHVVTILLDQGTSDRKLIEAWIRKAIEDHPHLSDPVSVRVDVWPGTPPSSSSSITGPHLKSS